MVLMVMLSDGRAVRPVTRSDGWIHGPMDTDTWMGREIPQTYYLVPGINMHHHTILLCLTKVKSPNKAKVQKVLFVPGELTLW